MVIMMVTKLIIQQPLLIYLRGPTHKNRYFATKVWKSLLRLMINFINNLLTFSINSLLVCKMLENKVMSIVTSKCRLPTVYFV